MSETRAPKPPKTYSFPTEIIALPTRGLFYPEGHPLSEGRLELKYMTAKEEDILTSTNLMRKGLVIHKLLESVVLGVDVKDLLIADRDAVLISTRMLGYGSTYEGVVRCSNCTTENSVTVDLKEMEISDIDENVANHNNEFSFELPLSKSVITWKLLTHGDDLDIREELRALEQHSNPNEIRHEITTRLRRIITSVDGETSAAKINAFVQTMPSRDSRALRAEIAKITPTITISTRMNCVRCGHSEEVSVPMGLNFFYPDE